MSVVIPSWNGAALLRRHLPGVLQALRQYSAETECLVVDDGSEDDTVAMLQADFPAVTIVRRSRNSGFSAAANAGIRAAGFPLILLLNNDMEVAPDFLAPLVARFAKNDALFAVSALQIAGGREGPPDGYRVLPFRFGQFLAGDQTREALAGHATMALGYANGGCSLFSREKLLAIGGFCELFDPFYWEDVELSVQALKRGWAIEFEPRSRVEHWHSSTTRRRPRELGFIPARNYFLLHWIVLDGLALWSVHLLLLPLRALSKLLRGQWAFHHGLLRSIRLIGPLVAHRRARQTGAIHSLAAVLQRSRVPPYLADRSSEK